MKKPKQFKRETWDPKRPYTMKHDPGYGYSVYRRKGQKVYMFKDDSRGSLEAEVAWRLMNVAYREGRKDALRAYDKSKRKRRRPR